FLGRIDQQVKVRGYRIEPGEIESTLAGHPASTPAVVTAYQYAPGDNRLAAYYTLADPDEPTATEELRSHLRATLPDYMVPTAYVALEAFPLTPNNKIDRSQLPAPDSTPARAGDPPRPGLETDLARIWEAVLGTPSIGRDDDFFDLGGHSLLAARMFAEVEALTGHHSPLSVLFRAPTIARLATALQMDQEGQGHEPGGGRRVWTSLVPVQTGGDRNPFFYVSPFLISALSFSGLGRYLGSDQPLYIFEPQGMDSDQPFHTSIDEMAAHYIEEMKEVQPRGPYWIGGHCAGSWVAFEMARQLQQQGEDLGLLVLVDSPPPGIAAPAINPYGYLASSLADFWREGRLIDALHWQMKIAADRVVVGRLSRRRGGTSRRIAKLRSVHAAAHRSYTGGRVRGDALLLRSSEYARLRSRSWHLDWSKLVSGELDTVVVPSTHAGLSIEAEPLARAIRGALDDAAELAEGVRWYPSHHPGLH
ncbi:MAG: thioesterase domain-containing protein, partial [Candidatus Dormibacteraceae bacterium]